MNIFILHRNPRKCAQMHCDKHVVKMILETAQILSTVVQQYGESKFKLPNILYKSTHTQHPCVIWAGINRKNFEYLCKLGLELCKEYTYRYGRIHKSECVIKYCSLHSNILPYAFLNTPFAQVMPEKYKNKNAVRAYRDYYNGEKLGFAKWTNREVPRWVK